MSSLPYWLFPNLLLQGILSSLSNDTCRQTMEVLLSCFTFRVSFHSSYLLPSLNGSSRFLLHLSVSSGRFLFRAIFPSCYISWSSSPPLSTKLYFLRSLILERFSKNSLSCRGKKESEEHEKFNRKGIEGALYLYRSFPSRVSSCLLSIVSQALSCCLFWQCTLSPFRDE